MKPVIEEVLICPNCKSKLTFTSDSAECAQCKDSFLIEQNKVFLIEPPKDVPKRSELERSELVAKENFSDLRLGTHKHLVKHVSAVKDGARVLDLSAGRSVYREDLARFSTVSTDFYPFDLIDIVADTSKALPLKTDSFDVVILSHVLEHMPMPELTLREVFRVLKHGGVCIAHTPFMLGLHDEPYDYYRYTKYGINFLLKKSGFQNIEVETISDFFDVYQTIHSDFFNALLARVTKDSFKGYAARYILRGIRKSQTIATKFFGHLLVGVVDERYPKAYGFVGYKL